MRGVGLKLVVLGLSLSSSWGNGHATTYRALLKAFAARGHAVTFLERDVPWYRGEHRDLPDPDFCALRFYDDLAGLEAHRGETAAADAVIVGSYVPEGVAVGRWTQAVAPGRVAFYDIDTPVTLAKLARGDHEYLSPELIPAYAAYLSFTGGPTLERLQREFRSPAARALYCSVDATRYPPAGRRAAVGPELPRHLQPRPPAHAGAPAAGAGAPRAAPALRRRRSRSTRPRSPGPPTWSASSTWVRTTIPLSTPRAAGR